MSAHGVLLDTNVASYLVRRSIESARYERLIRGRQRHLSVISIAELRYGALKRNWGHARCSHLESFIRSAAIVPVSEQIANVAAIVMNRSERAGRRLDRLDAWIAATAMFHQLPVVTHDRDFLEIGGLTVITELKGVEVREPAIAMHARPDATANAIMDWVRRYLATLEPDAA